jgi:hypothetical protein
MTQPQNLFIYEIFLVHQVWVKNFNASYLNTNRLHPFDKMLPYSGQL